MTSYKISTPPIQSDSRFSMTEHEMGGTYVFWQPTDSVGISTVDKQHQKLFFLINSLYTAICSNPHNIKIEKAIGELVYYTEYHFETEKSYLKHLPDFAAHEIQHADFSKKILHFVEEYQSQPQEILLYDMISFLSAWLRNHIQGTDIQQFTLYQQKHTPPSSNNTN